MISCSCGRVCPMGDDEIVYKRDGRHSLVGCSLEAGRCKCGWSFALDHRREGVFAYCMHRQWWNFWRHDRPSQIVYAAR